MGNAAGVRSRELESESSSLVQEEPLLEYDLGSDGLISRYSRKFNGRQ